MRDACIKQTDTEQINYAQWFRANPKDFDGWATAGNDGWSNEDFTPFFKKAENFVGPSSTAR